MTTVPGVSYESVRHRKTHKKFPRGRVYQNSGSGGHWIIKVRPPEPGDYGSVRHIWTQLLFGFWFCRPDFISCLMVYVLCQRPRQKGGYATL